jgi:F-type H+-transporting ATPase subunit b
MGSTLIADARAQAEQIAEDAAVRMDEFVTRRTAQAEAKIAFAEAQATAQVRAAAADHAARAAEIVLRGETRGAGGADLVTREIGALKARLN